MAELYLARHIDRPQLEKLWVVKRVLPHLAESPEFVRMFQNEARLASTLQHPNVAAVVDYGVAGEEHYLVMEYVHGKDARALLRAASADDALPLSCALAIVVKVASALHYAHERRDEQDQPLEIVHRDVSPSNVLLGYDGTVRLADFGIAKAAAQTNVTRTGTIKGKAGYMSPEQCRGDVIDRRTDVFGLGVLLLELTTLRRAFSGPSDLSIMSKVVVGDYRRPREHQPDYPEDVAAIVDRALSVDRERRFGTVLEMQQAVEAFARAAGISLERAALSAHVTRLFGSPPYPAAEFAEQVATEVAVGTEVATLSSSLPVARRRGGWHLGAVAAVVLGLGGFALGSQFRSPGSPEFQTPTAAPAVLSPNAEAPTLRVAASPEGDPAGAKTPSPAPEATATPTPTPAETPTPTPDVASEAKRTPKRAKARRPRSSKSKKKPAEDTRRTFGPPKWGK